MRNELKKIFLKSGGQFISGESLSNQLHVSRSAIWKHIEELRDEGYEFEAVRRKGYRLLNFPDDISSSLITEKLSTKWLGEKIYYYKELNSTQIKAHEFAKSGAENGTIIITNNQTSGKGRLGREWFSEKNKGIWLSVILRPTFSYQQASLITLFTSIVISRVLNKLYGIKVKIKWPNDIYYKNKKLAGILTEVHGEQDKIHYLVIGIGINTHKMDFPDEIINKAISLEEIISTNIMRSDIIIELLMMFENLYTIFTKNGFNDFFKEYNESLLWKNEDIKISNFNNIYRGKLAGIDNNGYLNIITKELERIKILSGEVTKQP